MMNAKNNEIKFSLILPIYNQEDIITEAYNHIKKNLEKLNINYEIILVENGSRDKTWKVVKRLAKKYLSTIAMQSPKGYGNAVLAGVKRAKGEYVSYMPSDGQVDPKIFLPLLHSAFANKQEITKIRRRTRESILRFIVMKTFAAVLFVLFRIPYLDVNGSPKVLLRKNFQKLDLHAKDSFIDAELTVKATLLHWEIKEIPMTNFDRLGGESTRSWRTFWEFFKNIYFLKTGPQLLIWQERLK